MKQVLLLSLVLFGHATTWVLDKNLLEERLPPGVTIEELAHILEKEAIDVHFTERENSPLWQRKGVTISLAVSPLSPYHLWISLEGRTTLDQCTPDEWLELYGAIWKARRALAETTGADSFMIFTSEEPRNGKGNNALAFEIIPAGFGGSGGVMDALEKTALNDYVFYNHFPLRNVTHSPEVLTAIQEKLATLSPSVLPEMPQEQWTQKLLHAQEALHESLATVYGFLAQSGSLLEGKLPPVPVTEEKVHEILIDLHKCAFCNPKVIEKQLVCEWKGIEVLMSHKPVSPHGNFLILPKRHQCAWDLTPDETLATFETIVALKKTLHKTTGSNQWICYIQDGPAVGQTVPHTHIHFFILPSPLKSAISGLQHIHNQRPILSYEEMRSACEKMAPLLLQNLYGNSLD